MNKNLEALHKTIAGSPITKIPRSLIACSRCRKLKLKCSGPGDGPCTRCSVSRSDCAFLPSEPAAEQSVPSNSESANAKGKISNLEQRLEKLESIIDTSMRSTQLAIQTISAHIGLPNVAQPITVPDTTSPCSRAGKGRAGHVSDETISHAYHPQPNLISKGILAEQQCRKLYDFFEEKCSEAIAFLDNTTPPFQSLCQSPVLLAAICTIGARGFAPDLYDKCLKEFYALAQEALLEPDPTLETLKGILLMSVWHKNSRLWGLALSISYQIGLPEIALSLEREAINLDENSVDQARTWLSFCCMDLGRHINRNHFISELGRYTDLGRHLLSSPYSRNVDYRIDAYLEVFQIASHARRTFQFSNNVKEEPISPENMDLLETSNQKLDAWYLRHSTDVDPVYQSYSKPQDRDRMKIPYNLIRMYTNGYVLHGLKSGTSSIHPLRIHFIKIAVDASVELLDCALHSMNYQMTLKYSIDYSESALGSTINYLLHACSVAYHHLDCNKIIEILGKAQEMFENANLEAKAQELSSALKQLEQASTFKPIIEGQSGQETSEENLWDTPDWLSNFRLPLSDFSLDEASLENIFLYSGE